MNINGLMNYERKPTIAIYKGLWNILKQLESVCNHRSKMSARIPNIAVSHGTWRFGK